MQLRWIQQKDIDKKKWDKTIAESRNQMIYGYSWFLDAACPGWWALVGGDYEYVFPVKGKHKLGIPYFYMPLFVQQLGVYSRTEVSPEICELFLEKLSSKFKAIEIYLNHSNFTKKENIKLSRRIGQWIDLKQGYEAIKSNYSTNLTRNLKKAINHQVTITEESNPLTIRKLFEEGRGLLLGEIKKQDYVRLESLLLAIQKHTASKIFVALDAHKEIVAGGFFAQSSHRVIYIKGGVTDAGRELNAMHLLVDHAIMHYIAAGAEIFDFGGSVAEPLIRFNRNFGGIDYDYYCFRQYKLPKTIAFFKKVF